MDLLVKVCSNELKDTCVCAGKQGYWRGEPMLEPTSQFRNLEVWALRTRSKWIFGITARGKN